MLVHEILESLKNQGRVSFSCEFFPPKSEVGETTLWRTLDALQPFNPDFVSVTYGAGGTTQDVSLDVTAKIVEDTGIPTVAHLTCVGATAEKLAEVVDRFAARGIRNILALRGDPVSGPGSPWQTTPGGYTYAIELVEMLASRGDFSIGVAAFPEGHPESAGLADDARVLAQKQAAGAHFAITNLFFDATDYLRLRDLATEAGCTMPIIPGLMPVTNVAQIERFTTLSGAKFPQQLAREFERVAEDSEAVIELGIDVTTRLAEQLLAEGAPGVHLYTLNRSRSTREVFTRLGHS